MPNRSLWTRSEVALALLDSNGGPFERSAFRAAYVAATPGSRDRSFGAIASDGTAAAIALVGRGPVADSVPPSGYGGIRSSRRLSPEEEDTFLRAARGGAGVLSLTARELQLAENSRRGREFATASVIHVSEERSYSRLARRSLKKAELAGASAARSTNATPFFDLYRTASALWSFRYPEQLIELLAANGAGVFHHVEVDGEVVSSMFTLVDGVHWMCWLAAQNERGRSVAASYVAYDTVLEEASTEVEFVNLGASAPGSGGAQFKSHLGAVEVPMVAWREAVPGWPVAQAVAAHARGLLSRFS